MIWTLSKVCLGNGLKNSYHHSINKYQEQLVARKENGENERSKSKRFGKMLFSMKMNFIISAMWLSLWSLNCRKGKWIFPVNSFSKNCYWMLQWMGTDWRSIEWIQNTRHWCNSLQRPTARQDMSYSFMMYMCLLANDCATGWQGKTVLQYIMYSLAVALADMNGLIC